MLFQNFLNTWWDHEIADSAQPRCRSIVTRPFSLFVRAGSGHETRLAQARPNYVTRKQRRTTVVEMSVAVGGKNQKEGAACSSSSLHPDPVESEQSTPASEISAMSSNSAPLNASKLKEMRHKAECTINKLEKNLEVFSRHIKR